MVHLLIVSHGPLAEALKESSKMFYGEMAENLETCTLFPEDSPEKMKERILEKIKLLEDGDGVLVFADLFAGTPCNMTALALSEYENRAECITGVNLPVLMEAIAMSSTHTLDEIVTKIIEQAPQSFINVRKTLGL